MESYEKERNQRRRPKGKKKKFHITYEILPPGTLKRNASIASKTPLERWEEVLTICAEIITESAH